MKRISNIRKKGYMKTIEIVLVIVLSVLFLITVLPKQGSTKQSDASSYLIKMENREDFRNFVLQNEDCYNSSEANTATGTISEYLPVGFDFIFCIDSHASSLPEGKITVDTLVVVGNYSDVNFKVLRLYYWPE